MITLRLQAAKRVSTASLIRCCSSRAASTRKPSYLHFIGKEPLVYRTLGQQLDISAESYSSREAIVSCEEKKRLSFVSLKDHVDRLAAGFVKIGLQPGDPIGIWAPNKIQWYLTMLAVARAGMVSVGINPAFQGPEVEYCLQKVRVKAVVAPESFKSQRYYEILERIAPEIRDASPGKIQSTSLPHLRAVIIDNEERLPGAFRFDEMLDLAGSDEVKQIQTNQNVVQPDSPCNIQFTSGTTGKPKAAVLSHYNFVNNGLHIGQRNEIKHERICVQVPLFHAFGVVISIVAGLNHGATLVLPSASFNPQASLNAIVNENCSVIHGTPTMYVDLIKKQREMKFPLKTAKYAITGGSPCSPQLFKDIQDVLGLKKVKTVFGMTETTAVVFQSLQEESDEHVLNTVGHIQDHIEAKVIDAEGKTVPFGQPGELCIRGYSTMLGYFDDEQKTQEMISADKWLRTGDQFILNEDGYGNIVGRLKEMIIRGGENVFPKEIEDFLNTHPDILETHAIGVPDDRMGEEVCAFIRLQDDASGEMTVEKIKEFCKGKIAHFKVPKYVRVVKDFPKTTSGKIQKIKLKEIFDKTKE